MANELKEISGLVLCGECDKMYDMGGSRVGANTILPCGHALEHVILGGKWVAQLIEADAKNN